MKRPHRQIRAVRLLGKTRSNTAVNLSTFRRLDNPQAGQVALHAFLAIADLLDRHPKMTGARLRAWAKAASLGEVSHD